jgi:FkbM family methyltransferase
MSALASRIPELLGRTGVGCVVDVGAHLGQFGRALRDAGYAGRIVSFEPVLPVFASLVKTCCRDDPAWEAHRLALAEDEGVRELNVAVSTDFSSFLEPNAESLEEFRGFTAVERRERVPVRRLDAALAEYVPNGERLFLKLDTQGSELAVLRGGDETLGRTAAVLVEVPVRPLYEDMPRRDEIVGHLEERGFAVVDSAPVAHGSDGEPLELDLLLERRA